MTKFIEDVCTSDINCSVPYEFVRLRYFFGQRLGLLEFTDEQAYFIKKQRFHNLHLHGAGVLCGLRASRYAPEGKSSTTIVKLSKGAAVDECGREIVVGWDNCIDVSAWVHKHRATNPDLIHHVNGDEAEDEHNENEDVENEGNNEDDIKNSVWIIICYQECPSDPVPAPRDPCECEPNACQNSRVREGFRLDLATISELPSPINQSPNPNECPTPSEQSCLVLARIDLVYGDNNEVTDIARIEHSIEERHELWSTSTIQAILANKFDITGLKSTLCKHPRLGQLFFAGLSSNNGIIEIPVLLADDENGVEVPILGGLKIDNFVFSVYKVSDTGTWLRLNSQNLSVSDSPPKYILNYDDFEEGRFRLMGEVKDPLKPIIDKHFRELSPHKITRWFELKLDDNGVLTMIQPTR